MIAEAQKQQVNRKITFFVQCFLSTDIAHTDSGTNKKYIIKVNNAKIFWALLMSLICCIPAGIPHISFLKQPEELKHEVCGAPHFAYQQSSCWQMLDLIKTAAPRQDREGSPPGQDQSWDNLPGNEKSTIVCRKYQNHHNHLSHCDLYLCSSSPWMSAATFTTFKTELVPSTWFQMRPPVWIDCCNLFLRLSRLFEEPVITTFGERGV